MWCIKNSNNTVNLYLKVSPNAKNNRFLGIIEAEKPNRLKVAIKAPAKDGMANKELISFLNKSFGLPKSNFSITKGISSSKKNIIILEAEPAQIISQVTSILKENHEQSNQLPFL